MLKFIILHHLIASFIFILNISFNLHGLIESSKEIIFVKGNLDAQNCLIFDEKVVLCFHRIK